MNKLFKTILTGFSLGCTIFTLCSVLFDAIGGGTFLLENWALTKMAIGTVIVSLGFSIPSLAYDNERLSRALQVFIHMGIGCTIMLITASFVGWIPTNFGVSGIAIFVIVELIAAFLIWFGFSLYYKKEAERLNEQIEKLSLK